MKSKLLVPALIFLLGILIYSNTFYSPFHFDDILNIVNNPAIKNILNLQGIWNFYPTRFIVFLTLALNYHFHQLNVFAYHVFNLAIHIGSAILVWWLARLIFTTPAMKKDSLAKNSSWIALFTALIFLAHPLQTESVTYIWQRCTSLAGFFYLFSLCLYIKARLLQIQNRAVFKRRVVYALSLVLALMSIFAKENSITLFGMVILCEFYFFKTDKFNNWKYAIIFLFLLPILPIIAILFHPKTGNTAWNYFLTQPRVIITYIRMVFVPLSQNLDYDYPVSYGLINLTFLISLAFLAAVVSGAIRLFSKYRLFSFAILWFFLTLSPDSSFIPLDEIIVEHRLYLSVVGYGFFLTSGLYYLFKDKKAKFIIGGLFLLVFCYSVMTYQRNIIWQDGLRLWSDVARKSPQKARPYNNRGIAYYQQGRFTQAISDYNQAIAINPNYAEAYYNRGLGYKDQGNIQQAIFDYTKAIAINPGFADAYYNRGVIHQEQGNFTQAISDYNKAIEINPNYFQARINREVIYSQQGDTQQTISDYSKAIAINSEYAEAYYNRGVIYEKQGNTQQAIFDYTKAIAINSDFAEAYYNRGVIYAKQGSAQQAISDYTKAIAINPSYAEAYYNRGLAYKGKGNIQQAISDYTKAIVINPEYAEAYNNRGVIYMEQGILSKAIFDHTRAITINPRCVEAYRNRAVDYYWTKEYDRAWIDVRKVEALGSAVHSGFLDALKKASDIKE